MLVESVRSCARPVTSLSMMYLSGRHPSHREWTSGDEHRLGFDRPWQPLSRLHASHEEDGGPPAISAAKPPAVSAAKPPAVSAPAAWRRADSKGRRSVANLTRGETQLGMLEWRTPWRRPARRRGAAARAQRWALSA
eukprot:scaffold6711_cov118-Isochrysis_galbana.AAC.2